MILLEARLGVMKTKNSEIKNLMALSLKVKSYVVAGALILFSAG